jgi:hypothetical protein
VDFEAAVVPVHVHAKVVFSVKTVGMLPPNVLDAKIVDTESEQERPPVMFLKAR